MKKRVEDLSIHNTQLLPGRFLLLELRSADKLDRINPGQFVEIEVPNCKDTFLRRPISIHDVDYTSNTLSLLIKIVGCGTDTLSRMEKGMRLNLIYPLGNGFSEPDDPEVILIGGGYGIAPFLHFGKELNKKGIRPSILLGANTKYDFVRLDEYAKLGELYLTTVDGSAGEKGLVTGHSILKEKSGIFKKIYCCGPEPMMMAVAAYAKSNSINCEVSLDNLMACGIGACICCVTETVRGNELVCTTGPVFNIKDLKW
jgi:dihydroorotate dehydrogenase electron transfer subunit